MSLRKYTVQYALDEGHIDEWWYEDALKLGLEANC